MANRGKKTSSNTLHGTDNSFLSGDLPNSQTFSPLWASTGKPASQDGFDVDPELLEAASIDIDDGDLHEIGDCHEDEIALLERAESSVAAEVVGIVGASSPVRGGGTNLLTFNVEELHEKVKRLEREVVELQRTQQVKDGEIRLLRDRQREQERLRAEQTTAARVAEDEQRQQQSEVERQLKAEVEKLSTRLSFQSHENQKLQKRLDDFRNQGEGKPTKGPSDASLLTKDGQVKTDVFPVGDSFASGFSSQKRPHGWTGEQDDAVSCVVQGSAAKRANRGLDRPRPTAGIDTTADHATRRCWDVLKNVPLPGYHGPLLLKELVGGHSSIGHMHGLMVEGFSPALNIFNLLTYPALPVSDVPSYIEKSALQTPQRKISAKLTSKDVCLLGRSPESLPSLSKAVKPRNDRAQPSHLSATLRNLLTIGWRRSTPLTPHQQGSDWVTDVSSATELFSRLAVIACDHCYAFQESLQTMYTDLNGSSSSVNSLMPGMSLQSAQVEVRNLGLTALLAIKRLLECSPAVSRQLAVCSPVQSLQLSAVSPEMQFSSSCSSEEVSVSHNVGGPFHSEVHSGWAMGRVFRAKMSSNGRSVCAVNTLSVPGKSSSAELTVEVTAATPHRQQVFSPASVTMMQSASSERKVQAIVVHFQKLLFTLLSAEQVQMLPLCAAAGSLLCTLASSVQGQGLSVLSRSLVADGLLGHCLTRQQFQLTALGCQMLCGLASCPLILTLLCQKDRCTLLQLYQCLRETKPRDQWLYIQRLVVVFLHRLLCIHGNGGVKALLSEDNCACVIEVLRALVDCLTREVNAALSYSIGHHSVSDHGSQPMVAVCGCVEDNVPSPGNTAHNSVCFLTEGVSLLHHLLLAMDESMLTVHIRQDLRLHHTCQVLLRALRKFFTHMSFPVDMLREICEFLWEGEESENPLHDMNEARET